MRTIKKYTNRRLYDTTESRYVNLEELARLIREGEEIQVVDVKSGDDLTRQVLLQILLELQDGALLFPPGLMHRIIRFGGDNPLQRAALQQVGAGLELLDAQVRQLERNLGIFQQRSAAGGGGAPRSPAGPDASAPPEAPASEAPASEAPASEAPASEAPASEAPASKAPPPAEQGEAAGSEGAQGDGDVELDALRMRLAALEKRLQD